MLQALNLDIDNPTSICSSVDKQICYRITNQEQVGTSYDGGATWQVDWQIPAGRKYYMQKHDSYPRPDTVPLDIGIVESNSGLIVVVAMGNQGVLVKSPDGNWNRYAVGTAAPTPYYATDFSEANEVLYDERIAIVLIAVCFFLILSICIWISAYVNSDVLLRKNILRACSPLGISIMIFLLYYLALFISPFYISKLIESFQLFVILAPFMGFIVSWLWIIIVSIRKQFSLLALVASIGFSLLTYFCLLFIFQLWALGTIPVYETAKLIDWVLGISVFLMGIIAEIRIAPLAMK